MKLMQRPTEDLIAITEDPDVLATSTPLIAARARLAVLEDEERLLIAMATGRRNASGDEIDDAKRRLSIQKGTQTSWYLEPAQEARDAVKALSTPYEKALTAAKSRVTEIGQARLKPLVSKLASSLGVAQAIVEEIQTLRMELGAAGVDAPEHPVPSLLPGQIIDFQLDLAKRKGLWG